MSGRPEPVEDGVPMSFMDKLKKKAEASGAMFAEAAE